MGHSGLQGIALAIGITSASHMEEVWAMLEHLGRTRFLQSTFMSPESQVERAAAGCGGSAGLESVTFVLGALVCPLETWRRTLPSPPP